MQSERLALRALGVVAARTLPGLLIPSLGLSDADSLTLQAHGLGGRRKMGCGVLVPWDRGGPAQCR
jgi:hypothetical protein